MPLCFTSRKEHWYQLNRKLGRLQSQSGWFGEGKNHLLLPWFKPWTIQTIAWSIYRLHYPGPSSVNYIVLFILLFYSYSFKPWHAPLKMISTYILRPLAEFPRCRMGQMADLFIQSQYTKMSTNIHVISVITKDIPIFETMTMHNGWHSHQRSANLCHSHSGRRCLHSMTKLLKHFNKMVWTSKCLTHFYYMHQ